MLYRLVENTQLTKTVWRMKLEGDTSAIKAPGQFVQLTVPGFYLRRPISICNWTGEALMLLVKVVGQGTHDLVRCVPGEEVDVLSGLGNGFSMDIPSEHPVLAGGGIGIAPLYGLTQRMLERGQTPTVALGFRTAKEAFYLEEFAKLGCRLLVATEDGTLGTKGFVTDCIRKVPECDYALTCGPLPMLKAIYNSTKTSGLLSFEERMGCGFGACMGCSCKTLTGYKRICKEGPVMKKEEILWES